MSTDHRLLATAPHTPSEAHAEILIWDSFTKELLKAFNFHEMGVGCLSFSPCGTLLVSVGDHKEPVLVIWDIGNGSI